MTSCRLPMIFGFVLVVCCLFIVSQPVNAFNDDEEFPCMSISNRSVIPEDGTWLSICLVDPSAPEGSSLTEMNVKILVDHPDPRQLEILLSRSDSPIMKTLLTFI